MKKILIQNKYLITSIVLNLLLIGMLAGIHMGPKPPRRGFEKNKHCLEKILQKEQMDKVKNHRKNIKQLRKKVRKIVRKKDFNKQEFKILHDKMVLEQEAISNIIEKNIFNKFTNGTLEERKDFLRCNKRTKGHFKNDRVHRKHRDGRDNKDCGRGPRPDDRDEF